MESSNKWYLNYCQRIHKRKLSEIKAKPSTRIDNIIPSSLSVVDRRQKVFQIKKSSNCKDLVKENKNIMHRISQIFKKSSNKVQKSKLLNSKSQKLIQVPIKRKKLISKTYVKNPISQKTPIILRTKTFANSPISQKTPVNLNPKITLLSSQISVPRLKLSNINIIQAPSDTLAQPLPSSFTETPLAMSPLQNSYIKIISCSSQSSSKNESF